MIITVFTTPTNIPIIQDVITSQERLSELVDIKDYLVENLIPSGNSIVINNEGIVHPIDWYNVGPPYILQQYTLFKPEILLATIYLKLDNVDAMHALLKDEGALAAEYMIFYKLKFGQHIDHEQLSVETYHYFDDYRFMHNHAVIRHYSDLQDENTNEKIHYFYNAALDSAPNDEYFAYSSKHYGSYLIDNEEVTLAEKILNDAVQRDISKDAKAEINFLLCQIWQVYLKQPYDPQLIAKIKDNLGSVMTYYENTARKPEMALVLEDATNIANISESFVEALGYITKAIKIYEEEQLEEFAFNAHYKKGILLSGWANSGHAQFYKPAAESFQQALIYFTKENFPEEYAEIQCLLGVIYSEIPDEVKKKSIWAAVSHSAFQESLSIFSKNNTPYQYALVCTSFGNALTKYPAAKLTDNYEKALYYYGEALAIRTADRFPLERSLTLLNFLEASWNADNSGNEPNPGRFDDMWNKATEVIALNVNEKLTAEGQLHLEKLQKLKELI